MQIESEWLQQQIDSLAVISEEPAPVVTRILFSDADLRARQHVKQLCCDLQLTVTEDAVGNIFARWPGSNSELPAIATGSHIDAIPNAGRYDGVVGVLGALAAIRALRAAGFKPLRSIELIVFTSEEPTRFGIGCLGSRLMSGALKPEHALALTDVDGKSLRRWLAKIYGVEPELSSVAKSKGVYAAFIELHIEQGPLLDRAGIEIGVVENIAAPATLRVQITGEGGHAGAVLMPDRHDALLAGAEIALAVERAAQDSQSRDAVATTGVFRIQPGAVNSVPFRADLEIDVRDTNLNARDAALERIRGEITTICHHRGVSAATVVLNQDAPATCDPTLTKTVEIAAANLGLSSLRMVSRAYHDALFMAQISPTAMIFIPCRDGVSHRPDEFASAEAISSGARLLAVVLQELAG
ncbi:MAG TPA: M20 family metallo-hydrolase [Chthoniobacterales bacterium]|nr:M20 family metallo-hydrolase [Chthoniobacterales bacterium]